MDQRIALIDGDSPIWFALHPKKILDSNNKPILDEKGNFTYIDKSEEEIIDSCNDLIGNILIETNCSGYVLVIGGKNNFRKQLNPLYKANRKGELPEKFGFTKQVLIDKFGAVSFDGAETDDYLNIMKLNIPNSFIACIDSDLIEGLQGTHYNWKKKEWITTTDDQANKKFWGDMIIGTHNNIKGIPKKGKVYVDKLFTKMEQYGEDFRTLVFMEYCAYFGEYTGIQEFTKNYLCIKLLDNHPDFDISKIKINLVDRIKEF